MRGGERERNVAISKQEITAERKKVSEGTSASEAKESKRGGTDEVDCWSGQKREKEECRLMLHPSAFRCRGSVGFEDRGKGEPSTLIRVGLCVDRTAGCLQCGVMPLRGRSRMFLQCEECVLC